MLASRMSEDACAASRLLTDACQTQAEQHERSGFKRYDLKSEWPSTFGMFAVPGEDETVCFSSKNVQKMFDHCSY